MFDSSIRIVDTDWVFRFDDGSWEEDEIIIPDFSFQFSVQIDRDTVVEEFQCIFSILGVDESATYIEDILEIVDLVSSCRFNSHVVIDKTRLI